MGSGVSGINKYMRFGTLPTSGKSLNFLKLTKDQRDDIYERIEDGDTPEQALQFLKNNFNSWKNIDIDDLYEQGVSVFKADSSGLPILENMNQVKSAAIRIGDPVFSVRGKVSGIGQDGEPVLSNTSGTQMSLQDSQIRDRIISTLKNNYTEVSGNIDLSANPKNVFDFGDVVSYMGLEFRKPKRNWK